MDLYETYLRDKNGRTWHPDDIREGIKEFLSDDGYRLSFNIEGVVFVLRKDCAVTSELRTIDEFENSDSVECAVTIRGHKPLVERF